MFHELNPDGYRNREYRPYILGEETTYNTVMYDPYRTYNNGMYRTDTHTLESYEHNVKQYFDLPRNTPTIQNMQSPEITLRQYQLSQQLENAYSPTSNGRGRQGSYAMLYST
jgi:hypothetical protein